ncbi:MAG: SDR family NAD(P)-dependent oxidoreductase [Candidatus Helarchaeota archaeon]|nr:SDR family NAD(P)-dependent oxidoreductase [Candidatus Helarchaeota archaeon]
MKDLKNKNCLLTGAAAGIGRSLAFELAKEGVNLFLADINMAKLEKVKDELGEYGVKVFTGRCDVSKYEDFEKLVDNFYSKFGELDILINNAGIAGGGFIETLSLEEWKRVIDVNLWSIIYSIKVFLPKMLERGEGYIVNTASGAGVVGLPFHIQYVASKFGVVGISEALYSELNQRGIDVSVICPSHVKTDIIERSNIVIPPNLKLGETQQEINKKLVQFKEIFWEKYNEDGITADQAARKYIKGIKKRKLYIFDRRLLSFAQFFKSISERIYKWILRRLGREYIKLIEEVLTEMGIDYGELI